MNDGQRQDRNERGPGSGYLILIPDSQNRNYYDSLRFAKILNTELLKILKPHKIYGVTEPIMEIPDLIALGRYDSLSVPSVLIEYAYIYEPILDTAHDRDSFAKMTAHATSRALKNYYKCI